ncbi:MAG: hypothetical protein J5592_05540 [Clostridia bacterium]|nr:hypothetical protein [Clostridia bacterium]
MKNRSSHAVSLLTLLLALLMLSASAVSCADTGTGSDDTSAQATAALTEASETSSIYDTDGYLLDKLPEKMSLGTDIALLYWSDVENPEFEITEQGGEIVEDALYTRDVRVKERLGTDIVYSSTPGNNNNNAAFTTYVQNAVKGGETLDIIAAYSMTTANISTLGLCENLLDYPVIDFSAPWWPSDLVSEATINNKLFFSSGDISTNMLYMMYTVFFSKSLIEEYGLEDPYTLVSEGRWTFEKFMEMADAVVDTAGYGTDSYIYGFNVTSDVHIDPWFYGAGLRTVSRGEGGVPVLSDSWHSEQAENAVARANAFLHSQTSTIGSPDVFLQDRSLFTMHRSVYAKNNLSGTDIDFGIAVTPKDSEEQEKYATCLAFPVSLYAICTASEHKNESATLLEALASQGYRTVTPALFEISLKTKYAKDSETGKMFDLIRETVVFDLGRLYTTAFNKRTYQIFRSAMSNATYTSYLKQYNGEAKLLKSYLDKLLSCFE